MGDNVNKKNKSVLLGAAFLMGVSAIGPGFLTQTTRFTYDHGANHGFIILISLMLALVVQFNIWRIIGVSGMRGQDIANKILPGLGFVIAFFIALGGFAFNIGNIGGAALGLNALAGIPLMYGYWLAALCAIVIFLFKSAKTIIDQVMKFLGCLMIVIVLVVMFMNHPPFGEVVHRTFVPNFEGGLFYAFFPIMTYLGGTVGGYIPFSGAHRLIDAGISGKSNIKNITKASAQGISIAAIMRVILFLAVFGVLTHVGWSLAAVDGVENPAAIAFLHGAGRPGFHFFGLLMFGAGLTSVIGAAYTSVTFLKTLFKPVGKYENYFTIGFILASTVVMSFVGSPDALLILVGFVNSLILPITLAVMLIASFRKDIVGKDYKHPVWLTAVGFIVCGLTIFMSARAFPTMIDGFRGLFS